MVDIQKADPAARRKVFYSLCIAGSVALLFGLIAASNPGTVSRLSNSLTEQFIVSPGLIVVAGTLAITPVTLFSIYLFILGYRIRVAKRFPLPGQMVIRDTNILRGRRAVLQGSVLQILAGIVFFTSAAFPFVLYRVIASLINAA